MDGTNVFGDDVPELIDPRLLGADDEDRTLRAGATYVPGRYQDGRTDIVDVEVVPTNDGHNVILAYSSLPRLVECMGEQQPWVELPATIDPASLQLGTGADMVLWDQELPQELRREDGAHGQR
ncbi:SAV_915 family protein [Actinosynnema mirum]|uniref:SseB protein N-terminal domain-containing protein n=2 Tax=Pseudonocardiaceae TaxID=2070 RepID=C6WJB2_ACTMD|nr:SAV_915 family protein [Actinosynnema mirum]ACU34544.1 hypothetical protein Amir_0578 [Actinosynnema mirum DSM 43827]